MGHCAPQFEQYFAFARQEFAAVTKSGTGTWDLGREDLGTGDAGTLGRGDVGTRGRWDAGRGDVGTRGRGDAGRGDVGRGDAEFAIYSFRWLTERYYMMESLPAD